MKNHSKIDQPFDVQYHIQFSGRTKTDGVQTVTSQIIRDKLMKVLEDMLAEGCIEKYTITAVKNNGEGKDE